MPKTNTEISRLTKLLAKLGGGFRKSGTQTKDSEVCVLTDKVGTSKKRLPRRHNAAPPVESSKQALICLAAKKKDKKKNEEVEVAAEEKQEDYTLFMQLYLHFVEENGREVYQYTLHSGSVKRAGFLSEAQLADDSFDWVYDCDGEEVNYEKTLAKVICLF